MLSSMTIPVVAREVYIYVDRWTKNVASNIFLFQTFVFVLARDDLKFKHSLARKQ